MKISSFAILASIALTQAKLSNQLHAFLKRADSSDATCDSQDCYDAAQILDDKCQGNSDVSESNVLQCVCDLDDDEYWSKLASCAKNCGEDGYNPSEDDLRKIYCNAAERYSSIIENYSTYSYDDAPLETESELAQDLTEFAEATGSVDPSSAIAAILSTLSGLSSSTASASGSGSSSSTRGAVAAASETSSKASSGSQSKTTSSSASDSSSESSSAADASSTTSGSTQNVGATVAGCGSLLSLAVLALL